MIIFYSHSSIFFASEFFCNNFSLKKIANKLMRKSNWQNERKENGENENENENRNKKLKDSLKKIVVWICITLTY